MRDGVDKYPWLRGYEGDCSDVVGGILVANELRVGMCVVPQKEGVVDRGPGVVDARKQANLCRDCALVQALEHLVRDGIRRHLMKRSP